MAAQPTGTVTLLFTDIQGSTALLQRLGTARYAEALNLHRRLLREAFARHNGYEVDSEGDAFFVAFSRAGDAVAAAAEAQQALASAEWPEGHPVRVRMGLHTGEPIAAPPNYVGLDVHRAARVMAAGHGGQVLLSAATDRLLDASVTRLSMGEHRLKDLLQPEPLYQLRIEGLPSEFPALKTLGNRPTNLPIQPNPLIGREVEVADVTRLLGDPGVRLVTLTGPGGVGKTRLALQAAAESLERFASGVFFVSLAPVREPELVVPTIAQALAVSDVAGEELSETLTAYLEQKQMLLVLDNFEQVIDASALVAGLLDRCARLKLLVTSRERLRVRAERRYAVPPLQLVDPGREPAEILANESVALFAARASDGTGDLVVDEATASVAAEICARLDGLPLAIELAAARAGTLGLQGLQQRLDQRLSLLTRGDRDADERQRTLRAAIAWSYDLLPEAERVLFARLAIFVDGCRLQPAEAVAGADGLLGIAVVDGLTSLVEKSLLRTRIDPDGESRLWMLETIREFANEQLAVDPTVHSATRTAFVDVYEQLARETQPTWMAPEAGQYHRRFRAELDNIREAVRIGLADGRPAAALAIMAFFAGQWQGTALYREAAALVDAAVAAGGANTAELEGMAHHCLGVLAFVQGDATKALRHFRASLPLLSEPGIRVWTSYAMFQLVRHDDQADAKRLIEAAVRIAEAEGHPVLRLVTWLCQAQAEADSGAIEKAHAIATQAVAMARDASPENGLGTCLFQLGEYTAALGNLSDAREHFGECLSLAQADEFVSGITDTLPMLALIELEAGDVPAANTHLLSLKDAVAGYDLDTAPTRGSVALIEAVIEHLHGNPGRAIAEWAKADQFRELQARNWNLVENHAVVRHLAPLRQEPLFQEIWESASGTTRHAGP